MSEKRNHARARTAIIATALGFWRLGVRVLVGDDD
jgi:hypothetical protein